MRSLPGKNISMMKNVKIAKYPGSNKAQKNRDRSKRANEVIMPKTIRRSISAKMHQSFLTISFNRK